jgi:hypothetical protein
MNTLGMKFLFPVGGGGQSYVAAWLTHRMVAVRQCLDDGLPEAALTLLYSGIDTLGLLNAPTGTTDASRGTFIAWCERYVLPRLSSTDVAAPTPMDLYAARGSVLHTSTAESDHAREEDVRELWYTFRGKAAVNLVLNPPKPPLLLEIERLVAAFEEGSRAFVADLSEDKGRFEIAERRAGQFFSWETLQRAS